MTRILNRYILKETAIPFLLSISVLSVTALLTKIIKLIELVLTRGAGLAFVAWFILSVMASFLIYIIPISFLIGVLAAFTRLSSDSEITAMKASGLSLFRIMRPILFFAIFVYMMNLAFTLYIFPWGNMKMKTLLLDTAKTRLVAGIEEKVFYDRFKGAVLYVDHISEDGELEGIYISEEGGTEPGKEGHGSGANIFFARKGVFVPSNEGSAVYLKLYDGTVHRKAEDKVASPGGEGAYYIARFSTYVIEMRLPGVDPSSLMEKSDRELYINELLEKIKAFKSRGEDARQLLIELHKRFALPASVFVFLFLGVPLGIQKVRAQRLTGFSVSLAVVLIYYVFLTAFETLGKNGVLSPPLSAWGPDIFLGAVGLYIFYMTAEDAPINPIPRLRGLLRYGK